MAKKKELNDEIKKIIISIKKIGFSYNINTNDIDDIVQKTLIDILGEIGYRKNSCGESIRLIDQIDFLFFWVEK